MNVPTLFVDADRVRDAAAQQIRGGPAAGEPAFHQWRSADAGAPSYWLVPVVRKGETVGLVRVLPDGRASASVALRGPAITSISVEDARRRCEWQIDRRRGEAPGDTLLVHDGPAGREASRVKVVRAGQHVEIVALHRSAAIDGRPDRACLPMNQGLRRIAMPISAR